MKVQRVHQDLVRIQAHSEACIAQKDHVSDSSYADGIDACNQQRHVLLSVLMPCLNEAETLGDCIEKAHDSCRFAMSPAALPYKAIRGAGNFNESAIREASYEIVVADNGSSDGSQLIAAKCGARVVTVSTRGYGAALLAGIRACRGEYVVMGDADDSYDFGEIASFLGKLYEGSDVVIGNRFRGGIERGAMPWHHRYIGNPALSTLGRWLYRSPCRDWHCGIRAFDRQKVLSLELNAKGMEFASEMIIQAVKARLVLSEIPVRLRRDGRQRRPHLRSFRDGMRHLITLLRNISS